MVLMKGSKRVFETPNVETSSSGSVRTVSLYGVTAYSDLLNCIIPMKSNAKGMSGTNTLNVNRLGAKNIKRFNSGNKEVLPDNWVGVGQIYQIYYDGTDFVLLNVSSNSSSQTQNTYIVNVDLSSLVAGTYTQTQMDNIVDSILFDVIGVNGIYLFDNNTSNKIYSILNSGNVFDSVANTNTYKFSFLDDSNILKTYTIVLNFNTTEYTVTVSTIDLTLRNVNNTQY